MTNVFLDLTVRILDESIDLSAFDCGSEEWAIEMAAYLKENALQEQQKGLNKTHVFMSGGRCIAYVSLVAASLQPKKYADDVPQIDKRYDDAPCALIGRLAVDTTAQGRGLGKRILLWVIHEAISWPIGVRFLTLQVSGRNQIARKMYSGVGFRIVRGLSGKDSRFMLLDLYAPGKAPTLD